MKRLIASLAFSLAAVGALAATLSPVQLLNPAGSTAGQAIVSTGPSTPPAWGGVTLSGLGAQAANTVVANATGSSASPTAVALPTCSTTNSALKYTSGSGFSCGTTFALTSGNLSQFAATTSAQLASVISDETGTGGAVFATGPTLNQPSINGVSNGSNAAAGSVGEYITNSTTGTSIPTSGTVVNATSVSLTAGDWDVVCSITFAPAASPSYTAINAGVSTTSVTFPAPNTGGAYGSSFVASSNTAGQIVSTPPARVSIAATTTTYCVATAAFSAGTMTVNGFIRARRVR